MAVAEAGSENRMERKIISISTKRQVTIPQKFFETLGFDNEAECVLKDGGIFIRPIHSAANEFAEEILTDLIAQGYYGGELLEQFKLQSKKVRPAVEAMATEAEEIAKNGKAIPSGELFHAEG